MTAHPNAKCTRNLAACEGCPRLVGWHLGGFQNCVWREAMHENPTCECWHPQHRERWLAARGEQSDEQD